MINTRNLSKHSRKKAIRIVYNLDYNESTKVICRKNKILYFDDEHILSCLQMAKTFTDSASPDNIRKIHDLESDKGTRTGVKNNLKIDKFKMSSSMKNSPYLIPYLWNNLHQTAQDLNTKSLTTFIKTQLTAMYA